MPHLIDGYNLLHASGILARGVGPGSLERTRAALLDFLAESLPAEETPRTTVVFDAGQSATGQVRSSEHRGLRVRFSAGKADADDLIEELIRANSAPRRLVVVSSDHRVQRAALRRRAQAIDSDKWFASVLRSRGERRDAAVVALPIEGLSDFEVRYWLKRFGLEDTLAVGETGSSRETPTARPATAGAKGPPDADGAKPTKREIPTPQRRSPPRALDDKPSKPNLRGDAYNPFPPGYAEDVVDES